MYIYFSSSYPSAVKLNGLYLGIIENTVKFCDVNLNDSTLVELCPIGKGSSVSFVLNSSTISSLPENVCVTDLKGGYLFHAKQNTTVGDFNIICQEKFHDAVITVFNENGLKISIETQNDFFADNLPLIIHTAKIKRFTESGKDFVLIELSGKENTINVYSLNGNIKRTFTDTVDSYQTDGNFTTLKTFKDIAKHKVSSTWRFENQSFTEIDRKISTSEFFNVDKLNQKILPYAFLEELYVGGDVSIYLGGNVLENKDKLRGFFGKFIGIMPPPIFRNENEIGLIYKKSDRFYYVDYLSVTMENRKIINLKKK